MTQVRTRSVKRRTRKSLNGMKKRGSGFEKRKERTMTLTQEKNRRNLRLSKEASSRKGKEKRRNEGRKRRSRRDSRSRDSWRCKKRLRGSNSTSSSKRTWNARRSHQNRPHHFWNCPLLLRLNTTTISRSWTSINKAGLGTDSNKKRNPKMWGSTSPCLSWVRQLSKISRT